MARGLATVLLLVVGLAGFGCWRAIGETTTGAATKIQWVPWSDQVFQQAKEQHKLVVLDLEAVWCHWCHVMDEKTYSSPAVARAIDSHYIAVRVDQDSRPDLANKYQDYGWPATIFFNSDGKELAKRAGFIEPADMAKLLNGLAQHPVAEADTAPGAAVHYSTNSSLTEPVRKLLVRRHMKGYDTANGAWSFGEKFMDADSEEYALTKAQDGDVSERKMARSTLDNQLKLLDPVWGGMYQYSTHGDWLHPHFEKLMSIQSDNLRMYCLGYALFQEPRYLAAAKSIARFMDTLLRSPEGAYYVSQDADLVAGQHSAAYFKLDDAGRRKQGIPRVDKHLYARENGWAALALTALYQVTGDKKYLDSALKCSQWIVDNRALTGGGFSHDAKDAAGPYLADTLYPARAFLSLYAVTGDRQWLKRAEQAGDFIEAHFQASGGAPGFTTAVTPAGSVLKSEPLLDENIAAARFFNLLSRYDGNTQYKKSALSALRYVATPEIAKSRTIFVAGVLLADREVNSDPVHITILGGKGDAQALALFQGAQRYPLSYKQVEWYDKSEGALPIGANEFPDLPKAAAFGCAFHRCSLPIFEPSGIAKTVDAFRKSQ